MTTFRQLYNYGFLHYLHKRALSCIEVTTWCQKILTLCAPTLKRNIETEFWRNEKMDSYLAWQGEWYSRCLHNQPLPWGIGMFICHWKLPVSFFFSFAKFQMASYSASVNAIDLGTQLSDLTTFLEIAECSWEYRGEESPETIHMESSNQLFTVKSESSHKCLSAKQLKNSQDYLTLSVNLFILFQPVHCFGFLCVSENQKSHFPYKVSPLFLLQYCVTIRCMETKDIVRLVKNLKLLLT